MKVNLVSFSSLVHRIQAHALKYRIKVWYILADIYRHSTNTEMALIRMTR